jgi:hypothetical protein
LWLLEVPSSPGLRCLPDRREFSPSDRAGSVSPSSPPSLLPYNPQSTPRLVFPSSPFILTCRPPGPGPPRYWSLKGTGRAAGGRLSPILRTLASRPGLILATSPSRSLTGETLFECVSARLSTKRFPESPGPGLGESGQSRYIIRKTVTKKHTVGSTRKR